MQKSLPVNLSIPLAEKSLAKAVELLEQIKLALTPSKEKWTNVFERSDLTNAGQVASAFPTVMHGYYFYNNAASVRSLKIYDKGSTPVVGSDRPKLNLVIPANGGANVWFTRGVHFAFGLSMAATTGVGDFDNTAGSAGDVVVNVFYE